MESKKPWQSKTVWLSLATALLPFVPGASAWVAANPEVLTSALSALFLLLRLITKDKIVIL